MELTQQLIDALIQAISFKFNEDGTCPNLTISKLRRGYYCSVVRYPVAKGGKQIICKAQAATLDEALKRVTVAFLVFADHQPDPIQQLAKLAQTSGNE